MANLRFEVVAEAFKKKPVNVVEPAERPSEYFGKNVFNRQKMYKYLPRDVYEKLIDVIDNGARLDRSIADAVAKRERCDPLHPLVPAPDRGHCRETRCLH